MSKDLFKNKYRNGTARAVWWNYAKSAYYFVTVTIKERQPLFGAIENNNLILSELGLIAFEEWQKTPSIRPDMNLELGEFVVMPDHFHAVIFIGINEYNKNPNAMDINKAFGPQTKNLSSIMRGFKSAITTRAKKLGYSDFGWQGRYYDTIIRDQKAFDNISNYIINNPHELMKFHSKNKKDLE